MPYERLKSFIDVTHCFLISAEAILISLRTAGRICP